MVRELVSTNPAKGYAVLGKVAVSSDSEIERKIAMANKAKLAWKELGIRKRIALLKPIYEEFASKKDELAVLTTDEIGKPLSESRAEIESALFKFSWALENGEQSLADEITMKDGTALNRIVYEPFGTAAVIVPWNFPFTMFVWGVIPNLVAGNTVIFKISEECPLMGKFIEDVMNRHKLPQGVFSEVYGASDVGKKIAEAAVNLIWFTGSTKVGRLLYEIVARKFIKAVLEMGGSSPAVIFEDVDLNEVVPMLYGGRFLNCGQVCDALKRVIVHESLFNETVDKLTALVKTKVVGDPTDEKTDIGSLVAKRQVDLLNDQVADAIKKGATVVTGGKPLTTLDGAFYEPTILTNVTRNMRVWKEEVFGPVLPIVPFKTEEEAIELANDTLYGLGARIFSKDATRAQRVASRIDAGTVEINNGDRWHPCNPFGGYKQSGMGRDHGVAGFRELCQIKLIAEK
ncbi:MAG: aldehyde dehydrogenase family protein [Nanoarchaeota archaeon]|nr:aldehyde dehydrogenase family protein [Nanoarchaeota archaeon]